MYLNINSSIAILKIFEVYSDWRNTLQIHDSLRDSTATENNARNRVIALGCEVDECQ